MHALIPSCLGSVTNWWTLQHLLVNASHGSLNGLHQGQTGGVPAFQIAAAGVFNSSDSNVLTGIVIKQ